MKERKIERQREREREKEREREREREKKRIKLINFGIALRYVIIAEKSVFLAVTKMFGVY